MGVSRHPVRELVALAQRMTIAAGDDTSYTLTPAGGRDTIALPSVRAFIAESSALPHTTVVFVPPRRRLTSSGVDAVTPVVEAGAAQRVEVLPDRLLVYAADGEVALKAVTALGVHPQSSLVRRSSLEDVFLRLTGRTLVD